MQITRNLLVSFFLLSLASGAKASVNKNEAIIYECTLDSGVIQQHFEVGQTQRIYLNTNGLMQIQMPLEQGNSFEQFLLERLLASGINEGCARFLVKHVDAELLKLTNGQLLARVNFAFDSEELSDTARDILQQTVTMLKTANQRYLIEGHTDNIGSEQYNLALGDRRGAECCHVTCI